MMLNSFDDLPKNPAMLLSVINMKLRDNFNGSLPALCNWLGVDVDTLLNHMKQAGWEFNPDAKKFW